MGKWIHFRAEPKLASKILNAVGRSCLKEVFQNRVECLEENFGESHRIILITSIVKLFVKIRFHAFPQQRNNSDVSKRHKLRKTTHTSITMYE